MNNKTVILVNFYREIASVNSRPLMPLACLYLASYLQTKDYHVIIQEVSGLKDIDKCINISTTSLHPV